MHDPPQPRREIALRRRSSLRRLRRSLPRRPALLHHGTDRETGETRNLVGGAHDHHPERRRSPAINWPKLAGIATSTTLTPAYYPTVDHGFGNESKAFATSLATSILNDELHEFGGGLIHMIRHSK